MLISVLGTASERERRVALTPNGVAKLVADGHDIAIVSGAGVRAGFTDQSYAEAGAEIVDVAAGRSRPGIVATIEPPS